MLSFLLKKKIRKSSNSFVKVTDKIRNASMRINENIILKWTSELAIKNVDKNDRKIKNSLPSR